MRINWRYLGEWPYTYHKGWDFRELIQKVEK